MKLDVTAEQLRSHLTKQASKNLDDASVAPETLFATYGTHVVRGLIGGGRLDYSVSADMSQQGAVHGPALGRQLFAAQTPRATRGCGGAKAFGRPTLTEWFVDVPSERAVAAVVIPELPKQAAPEPPERTEAPGVKVWVLPGAFGLRVLSANLPRPAGAKLMRLVAEERDQQALNVLDALASR